MSDIRQHAHELIDGLPETQVSAAVGFLESIVDPDKATLRNAPFDDEPETDAERLAIAQARISLQKMVAKAFPTTRRCGVRRIAIQILKTLGRYALAGEGASAGRSSKISTARGVRRPAPGARATS